MRTTRTLSSSANEIFAAKSRFPRAKGHIDNTGIHVKLAPIVGYLAGERKIHLKIAQRLKRIDVGIHLPPAVILDFFFHQTPGFFEATREEEPSELGQLFGDLELSPFGRAPPKPAVVQGNTILAGITQHHRP